MNKLIKLQAGVILTALALVVGIGAVSAETPPASTPPGNTLEQRIAQRKAERTITLTAKDQQRLVSSCVGAQNKLRLIQNDDTTMLEKRTEVYGVIDAKLWGTIGQLKLANQDTFQLEKQRLAMADKTAAFQSIIADYKQAVDDTLLINCKADPVGFKAMLDTVRIYYGKLGAQATDSHNYVINTLKPALQSFVDELQPKPAPAEEGN